jgi:microcompartment protein CcmL/EutN
METPPAIALFEFDSIVVGTHTADAMVKKAPITIFRIGTIQPGRYLVLIGGSVAAVEESRKEGLRTGGEAITDEIFLPDVHPQVYAAVSGQRHPNQGDALGIIETSVMPIVVAAADKAVKAAMVTVVEIRLGDGLGGKGIVHVSGAVRDVQAAISAGVAAGTRPGVTTRYVIIPIQHDELRERIETTTEFQA